ncbi:MAG: hypothetical protein AAF958_11740 [Planctomycetota bacterium]
MPKRLKSTPFYATIFALICLQVGNTVGAADVEKPPIEDLKCFIMPKRKVAGKKVMDYKKGKLYLCCGSCVKRMGRTLEKYEARANHQLVQTKQYVQTACPLGGGEISESSPTLMVGWKTGDVKIKFASEEHKNKIAALEPEERIEKVFAAKTFDKHFEPKKKDEEK